MKLSSLVKITMLSVLSWSSVSMAVPTTTELNALARSVHDSVQGATIRNISRQNTANDVAISIQTTRGTTVLHVNSDEVGPVLAMLENPRFVGRNNASIARDIMNNNTAVTGGESADQIEQSNAVLIDDTTVQSNAALVGGFASGYVPSGAAFVTSTVASANQQASK